MAKKTVTARVAEDVYTEWSDYLEESPKADSMSHLIRLAVNEYVEDDDGQVEGQAQSGLQARTETTDAAPSGEVLETLNRIERTVEDIQDGVAVLSRDKTEEQFNIVAVLTEIVPSEANHSGPPERWALPARELAARMGVEPDVVAEELEEMDAEGGYINSIDDDGETKYYKTE